MIKSGLIFGAAAFVCAVGAALLSPLCVPCVAIALGLGAGYAGSTFDKPADNGKSAKLGAQAGGIGGVGAILGQLAGAAINGIMIGPERMIELQRSLGLNIPSGAANDPSMQSAYWVGVVGSGICIGLLDVALMAGLGALGGVLWWRMTGKNVIPQPVQNPPQV